MSSPSPSPPLLRALHPAVLRQLYVFRKAGLLLDCFISPSPGYPTVPVHSTVIGFSSSIIRKAMLTDDFLQTRTVQLDVQAENPLLCLQVAIDFIYTGHLNMEGVSPQEIQLLAEQTQILALSDAIKKQQEAVKPVITHDPLLGFLPFNPQLINASPFLNGINMSQLLQQYNQIHYMQMLQSLHALNQAPPPPQQPSNIGAIPSASQEVHRRRRLNSESAVQRREQNSEEDNTGSQEMIIPSNDKEGWCRNKKYIEKTEAGYQCTVCKKVYGRYNSVSYHVTIYHRNPPIKCDLDGCHFTTREARYIHFHKYYRHGVPLPQSIDQGSRKCPYCKHVSKSPAMLEKHIKRHQLEGDLLERPNGEASDAAVNFETAFDEETRLRTTSVLNPVPEVQVDVVTPEEEEFETKGRSFTL